MQFVWWKDYEAVEIEMAKKISELEQELADTKVELEIAQIRIAELETRSAFVEACPGPPNTRPAEQQLEVSSHRMKKKIRLHGDEILAIHREIVQATGDPVLAKLRIDGFLGPEADHLTVADLIPDMLAEKFSTSDLVLYFTSDSSDVDSSSGESDDDSDDNEDDEGNADDEEDVVIED
ncbi:hypothetical protein KSP39_PZI014612 [Platanthera zijinensis]|uniref:Uncharacterized protein n=1 Tax=Platanthera zijinensis TaxID=2320716 RepID=A0AAP0BAD9_9ASPA